MKNHKRPTLPLGGAAMVLAALLCSGPTASHACTTFGFGKHRVVGKSYDWRFAEGLLMVNPRGQVKQAPLLRPSRVKAARWRARYGSLTFNQYGRGFPNGGINERGFAIEIMWLSSARYGKARAGQRAVNELAFIQYLLDNAGSIDDAVRLARKLHVSRGYVPVHYMACDRGGNCATLEHVGGKLVVHRGAKLPVAVLANSTYARSLAHVKALGKRAPAQGSASLARFARAARVVRAEAKRSSRGAVARAFALLDNLFTPGWSQWQIVYETRARRVSFRRAGARKTLFTVALSKVDFGCKAKPRVIDLTGAVTGKPGKWVAETAKTNEKLVLTTTAKLKGLPPGIAKAVAAYPKSMTCR